MILTTNQSISKIKRRVTLLFSFLLLIFNAACTSITVPQKDTLLAQTHIQDSFHVIDDVPVIAQKEKYCGPAAFATILSYETDDAITQEKAAEMVYTPGRSGTFQHDMVSGIQRAGLLALPVDNIEDMLVEIKDNRPVIIFQNLALKWYPAWHYSVVTGYDLDKQKLLVHGGTQKAKWKDMRTILKTWKRAGYWGYIAAKPNDLPQTSSEKELLQAAAGLETAKHLSLAAAAYISILKKYPNSYEAHFGLGNIAMTKNEYVIAEKEYQAALSINPDHIYSINNKAYALSKQGKTEQACIHLDQYKALQNPILTDSQQELCAL